MSSVVQILKLEQIRTDGGTQPRTELNEQTVADYAEAITEGAKFPPVAVFHDGADYWLADGFHRLFAHKKIGALDIEAEIRQGTKRDAILHSVGANDTHGLRRSNADKRKAVLTLLEDLEWSKWSDNKIAQACGVNQTTVSNYRRSLMESLSEEAPVERTYTTRHGTEAVMKTGNIGRPAQAKTQDAPAKGGRKLNERPADIPAHDHMDELAEARYTINEIAQENEELRDRLAVEAMDATDDEKLLAQTTIMELRAQVKALEAELDAVKSMRDQYITENEQLKRQCVSQRRKLEKLMKAAA